jgi:hypothetical protein
MKKREIGNIYLSWRKGPGSRRYLVGRLKRNHTQGVKFEYLKEEASKAQKEGFVPYTEFPDIDSEYNKNVLDVFGQRIMKSERTDVSNFYDFWEIDQEFKEDKYYMLAHTQGWIPTDNFEFLADFNPIKGLSFLTDLAGVTKRKLDPNLVKPGDELRFEYEPDNNYDKYAIKVYKGQQELGYIKKIHNLVFQKKRGNNFKLRVKATDKNGTLKKIFVKVYL